MISDDDDDDDDDDDGDLGLRAHLLLGHAAPIHRLGRIIQTEAERRRREAGVPTIVRKWARLMYAYMFVCMYDFRKYLAI